MFVLSLVTGSIDDEFPAGQSPSDGSAQAPGSHAAPPAGSGPEAHEQPVPESGYATGPAPQASAKPNVLRRLFASAVLVAIVGGLGVSAYKVYERGVTARAEAEKAIASAQTKIEHAEPAVEPGTNEEAEYKRARALLDEAMTDNARGSILKPEAYKSAAEKAQSAASLARGISQRVVKLAEQASAGGSIDLYFELYSRFPRTYEGQRALDDAAKALLEDFESRSQFEYLSDIERLTSLAEFCTKCPGEVPGSIRAESIRTLRGTARERIKELQGISKHNIKWATALRRGKSLGYGAHGLERGSAAEMRRIANLCAKLDCDDYKAVFSHLCGACQSAERCLAIARKPERETRTTLYFGSSQLRRMLAESREIQRETSTASRLLAKL